MNSATQSFSLQGGAGPIEALRDVPPEGAVRGTVVIAHPHPLFGGTMQNKVVQTLARAFVQCGWQAVRFNFRGVGASAGVYDEGRGEAVDMLSVVAQVAPEGPLALAGFSFGAFVTSHVAQALLARGDRVVGLDSLNDYYDPQLKRDRLTTLAHPQRVRAVAGLSVPSSWTSSSGARSRMVTRAPASAAETAADRPATPQPTLSLISASRSTSTSPACSRYRTRSASYASRSPTSPPLWPKGRGTTRRSPWRTWSPTPPSSSPSSRSRAPPRRSSTPPSTPR